MLSRIYLEITNICNRSCSFCPGTKRPPRTLSVSEFTVLAQKLRPYTKYLYLHVMGEPLTHPDLAEILAEADRLGFRIVLTTNGTLLSKLRPVLLNAPALHKVNISLHSFEANEGGDFSQYLDSCIRFGLDASRQGILIDFRLWNLDGADTHGLKALNHQIESALHTAFAGDWTQNTWGWRMADRAFLHYGEKFDWPDLSSHDRGEDGGCRALRDQIAVLSDGTVVPCCLDHEGDIALGNLFSQSLEEILTSELARTLRSGFSSHKRLHALCRRCGYAERFR